MIEQSQIVLLEAIKASLFGITFSYSEDTDWDAVIKEAKLQTVLGLISPVIPIHDESSDQGKAYYMRLLHEQDKLIKLFDNNDISCVILKGCAAAIYYPKPYLRSMGDVDFLVSRDQFDEAMKLMESNGYVCIEGKDEDGQPIQGVRHLGYLKNGIEFELHHHFSSNDLDIDDILERAIDKREYKNLNGYNFPVLPQIENGLVLLSHIHLHLKNDNLGLRQIIDWEMYFHSALNSEESLDKFMYVAKKTGLFELAINVTRMCEKYLGLSKSIEPIKRNNRAEGIADELLENLLTYGNFGRKQSQSSEKSGKRIRTVIGKIKKNGFYSYFQENGLKTSKLCRKYPVLKPFAFIHGLFRFGIRGITGIIRTGKIKEQVKYIKDKKQYYKDLGIRTEETREKRK